MSLLEALAEAVVNVSAAKKMRAGQDPAITEAADCSANSRAVAAVLKICWARHSAATAAVRQTGAPRTDWVVCLNRLRSRPAEADRVAVSTTFWDK